MNITETIVTEKCRTIIFTNTETFLLGALSMFFIVIVIWLSRYLNRHRGFP